MFTLVSPLLISAAIVYIVSQSILTIACINDEMSHMGDAVTSTRP